MSNPISTPQAFLASLVLVGDFATILTYILLNRAVDEYVIAIVSGSFSLVLGFFFGHANGTTSALAVAATALANRTNPNDPVHAASPTVDVVP